VGSAVFTKDMALTLNVSDKEIMCQRLSAVRDYLQSIVDKQLLIIRWVMWLHAAGTDLAPE
jgi:hypothetical protein